jgi:murein L,D-transpeptidase YafK
MYRVFIFLVIFVFIDTTFFKSLADISFKKSDRIVVLKSKRLMLLMSEGKIIRAYKIALGKNPVGPKTCAGDKKTPEGVYKIDSKKSDSKFYKALHISYPNEDDIRRSQKVCSSPGGEVMIHGLPNGKGKIGKLHRTIDWTDGCIAVTNKEMDEIWDLVPDGTPIEIKP